MVTFNRNFLFLDNPRGGVEDIEYIAKNNPWCKAVYLNVHAHTAAEWEATTVISRCIQFGIDWGPWGRTWTGQRDADGKEVFDPTVVERIVEAMGDWNGHGIVNSEKEVDGRDDHLRFIADECQGFTTALSVLPTPFHDNDWTIVNKMPFLAQIMPQDQGQNIPSEV